MFICNILSAYKLCFWQNMGQFTKTLLTLKRHKEAICCLLIIGCKYYKLSTKKHTKKTPLDHTPPGWHHQHCWPMHYIPSFLAKMYNMFRYPQGAEHCIWLVKFRVLSHLRLRSSKLHGNIFVWRFWNDKATMYTSMIGTNNFCRTNRKDILVLPGNLFTETQ